MKPPIWRAKAGNPDEAETAEDVAQALRQWQTEERKSDLREALLQMYARSAELLNERVNQLPENYFRAFLNEAGVDLLPPKPAHAEVTFHLPPTEDSPAYVVVPAGTQVATQPSATQAEVIFETTDDLVVMPNQLVKCVSFDARAYTEVATANTAGANNSPDARATENGNGERIVFAKDGGFAYAALDPQGQPSTAAATPAQVALFTGTRERERMLFLGDNHFSYTENDGAPPTAANEAERTVSDFERQQTRFELKVAVVMPDPLFTLHGTFSQDLAQPAVSEALRQEFAQHAPPLTKAARIEGADAHWRIVEGERRYLIRKAEQRFTVIRLHDWQLAWYYWNNELEPPAWAPLNQTQIEDHTNALQSDGIISFRNLPVLTKTKVGDVESYWLACKLTGGQARNHLPTITALHVARTLTIATAQTIPIDAALAATQGGTIFTPLLLSADEAPAMLPFGPLPQRLDAFYLRADHAFQQAGAKIELAFQLESVPNRLRDLIGSRYENKLAAVLPQIAWEYYTKTGWQTIKQVTPKLIWGDLPDRGWGIVDITHESNDQEQGDDPTDGFLDLEGRTITLTLGEATPAPLTINEESGYWLRARIVEGAFGLPGEVRRFLFWATGWTPPVTFAPLIQDLTLQAVLPQKASFYPLAHCFSRIDQCWGAQVQAGGQQSWRDKPIALQGGQAGAVTAWSPFTARDEGPALYLGFQRAFPAGKWLRLLFEVNEQEVAPLLADALQWQFWNGAQQTWQTLQPVIDDTKGLTRRHYLGFYAPADHGRSLEFGQTAYWLRARPLPDQRPQVGVLGHRLLKEWRQAEAVGRTATLSFDKPVRPLTYQAVVPADNALRVTAGAHQTLLLWQRAAVAAGQAAPVRIDASPAKAADGAANYLMRYHLRRVRPKIRRATVTPMRQLGGIRLNTVAVINKQTIKAEVIGQSNGQANQRFTLVRRPVLDQVSNGNRYERLAQAPETFPYELVLEVAEFDPPAPPPATDRRFTTGAPTPQPQGAGEAQWHEWQRINHFAEAGPTSRVYQLDAVQGLVTFGDGKHGLIPLAGSKIRARHYCTHAGSDGNVGAGQITVLRNPTGDLAKIEGVTNLEAASGGRAPESVANVMERGPRAIKNQGRAVSADDLAWLARHSGADLVNAYPMTVRDQRGRALAGQAGLVILPRQLAVATPIATAAQQRMVKAYLAQYLQANLQATDALTIRNPAYVMVDVTVWLVAKKPDVAEQLQRAATDLLQQFLHPIQGGPHWHTAREQGWPFGRDLFVSQLYAQLESLPTVDYVNRITVHGSMLQYQLHVGTPLPPWPQAEALPAATIIPAGTQISTLDERKKLILSESLFLGELLRETGAPIELSVHGFNRGDDLAVWCEGEPTPVPVRLGALCADGAVDAGRFLGRYKISLQVDHNATATAARLNAWSEVQPSPPLWLESRDGRVRLPLIQLTGSATGSQTAPLRPNVEAAAPGGRGGAPFTYTGLVAGLMPGEFVSLFMGQRRLDLLWPVVGVATVQDRVYIPAGYLIASGQHQINLTLAKVGL